MLLLVSRLSHHCVVVRCTPPPDFVVSISIKMGLWSKRWRERRASRGCRDGRRNLGLQNARDGVTSTRSRYWRQAMDCAPVCWAEGKLGLESICNSGCRASRSSPAFQVTPSRAIWVGAKAIAQTLRCAFYPGKRSQTPDSKISI